MTILCVTPNVALDRTLRVPGFAAGGVWRARDVHTAAGGKGLNVARALLRLGRPARCTGLVGGDAGQQVAMLAESEGLSAHWTWIDGETRTSVIVVGDHGAATVINEPGPAISVTEWARFTADVAVAAKDCAAVCISGSLPRDYPASGMASLIAAASAPGRPVWLDTSGGALQEAVAAASTCIKINGEEAEALLGQPVRNPPQALRAAREILRRGPRAAAITLGSAGAVLMTRAGSWHARSPLVEAVNPVGSGDCFLAGLAAGLSEDSGEAEALQLAMACGAANVMTMHAADVDLEQVERLASAVIVREGTLP